MVDLPGLSVFLVINAVLGLLCFEWAWHKTRRFRNPIIELNAQFPELCRHDAPKWRRWQQYPGALTILIPRLVLLGINALLLWGFIKLWLIGYDPRTPMRCMRKFLIATLLHAIATLLDAISTLLNAIIH